MASVTITTDESSTSARSNIGDGDDDVSFQNLVDWIRRQGGRVDSRLGIVMDTIHSTTSTTIRCSGDGDGDDCSLELRGLGALHSEIPNATELLFLPWDTTVLMTNDDCAMIQFLDGQIGLGPQSQIHSILQIVVKQLDSSSLAAFWSERDRLELQGLPPGPRDAYRHVGWFEQTCQGSSLDEIATVQALLLVVSYSTNVGVLPLYYLMNHHRGKRNTHLDVTEEGVKLWTTTDISKGSQVYTSYGREYTSEIFRDYGFVERWPRRWYWDENSVRSNNGDRFQPSSSSGGGGDGGDGTSYLYGWWQRFIERLQRKPNVIHRFEVYESNLEGTTTTTTTTTTTSSSSSSLSLHPVVMIEPPPLQLPEDPLVLSVEEQQGMARRHTEALSSAELTKFLRAARQLLDEVLPTTITEDEQILAMLGNDTTDMYIRFDNPNHFRRAVEYRLTFKRDLQHAIQVATMILDHRGGVSSMEEL